MPRIASGLRFAIRARRSQSLWLCATACACAGITAWVHPHTPVFALSWLAPGEISLGDAKAMSGVVWVDARNATSYASSHVPGAINLSEEDWANGVGRLVSVWSPRMPIIVYCGSASCGSAEAVASRLRGPEYAMENVHVLDGGWEAYVAAH